LVDFHADLVFEEFGVFEGCFVEDEDVGEGRDNEVDCCAGKPGEGSEGRIEELLGGNLPCNEE
jgi:hypothetical protein